MAYRRRSGELSSLLVVVIFRGCSCYRRRVELALQQQVKHWVPTDFAREFEKLWEQSSELSFDLIKQYSKSRREFQAKHFEPEAHDIRDIPEPRPWQTKALEIIERFAKLATNVHWWPLRRAWAKTWLAAFDIRQLGRALNRGQECL